MVCTTMTDLVLDDLFYSLLLDALSMLCALSKTSRNMLLSSWFNRLSTCKSTTPVQQCQLCQKLYSGENTEKSGWLSSLNQKFCILRKANENHHEYGQKLPKPH